MFQFDHTDELYAHMNITTSSSSASYIRPWATPSSRSPGVLLHDDGGMLIPRVDSLGQRRTELMRQSTAPVTFPLGFAEIVWSDGPRRTRDDSALGNPRFGKQTFEWRAPAAGWKWARVALWDVSGTGAFVNPVWNENWEIGRLILEN